MNDLEKSDSPKQLPRKYPPQPDRRSSQTTLSYNGKKTTARPRTAHGDPPRGPAWDAYQPANSKAERSVVHKPINYLNLWPFALYSLPLSVCAPPPAEFTWQYPQGLPSFEV